MHEKTYNVWICISQCITFHSPKNVNSKITTYNFLLVCKFSLIYFPDYYLSSNLLFPFLSVQLYISIFRLPTDLLPVKWINIIIFNWKITCQPRQVDSLFVGIDLHYKIFCYLNILYLITHHLLLASVVRSPDNVLFQLPLHFLSLSHPTFQL